LEIESSEDELVHLLVKYRFFWKNPHHSKKILWIKKLNCSSLLIYI